MLYMKTHKHILEVRVLHSQVDRQEIHPFYAIQEIIFLPLTYIIYILLLYLDDYLE